MTAHRVRIIGLLLLLVLIFGTTGYRLISAGEASWVDCLYMTVITVTSVGYAEVVDLSNNPVGRIFTVLLIIGGMSVVLYAFGTFVAFLVEGELAEILRRRKMSKDIARLHGHFIVCGAGDTGYHAICELARTRRPFVAIDRDPERLRRLRECEETHFIEGDATEEETLIEAGIERAAGILCALSSDQDNLFVTMTARELNPNLRIVTRAIDLKARDKMLKAGADSVVSPNHIGGLRMVSEMVRPSVVSFLDIMLRDHERALRIEEVPIEQGSELAGKTLSTAPIRDEVDALVLAVRTGDGESYIFNPTADQQLRPGMILVVMADVDAVQRLREMARARPKPSSAAT